jgi:hypothetical protein
MKAWWKRVLAELPGLGKKVRELALEDQVAAQRQTIEALRHELSRVRNDGMAAYDNLLDRHEQLQAVHRELERKYAAVRQPHSAGWMLAPADRKAVRS